MAIQAYINFRGNCREAVKFYAKAFEAPEPKIMAYGDMPPGPGPAPDPATKDLVMHAEVEFAGSKIMFSDTPPSMPFSAGDNITLMVQESDPAKLTRWFNALKDGGKVHVELGPQFWSKLYGYVVDKFGIGWQLSLGE
jgi:PhnB protein